jgi:hypothetical protein
MRWWVAVPVGVAATVAVVAATVLIAGGAGAPRRYLEPWSADYHEQFDDPRVQLVAHGLLAASGHNEQPWRVRLDPVDDLAFELFADADRLTPVIDPLARQTLVSQGTFLEYIRVAGLHLGWNVDITLFPDSEYDESALEASMRERPVARIEISPAEPDSIVDVEQLFRSDTNRAPYLDQGLTARQRDAVSGLASETEGLWADAAPTLTLVEDPESMEHLSRLAVEGARIEAAYPEAMAESAVIFRPNEYAKNDARSGFSIEGQGTSGFMMYVMQGLVTLVPAMNDESAAATRFVEGTEDQVAHTPAWALITTPGNTRTQQVEAGILFSRFELRARAAGLVMQPLSQVLEEYPQMAEPYADVHSAFAPDGSTIQMLVRVGAPTVEFPTTMRRDVRDLLIDAGE